MSGQEIKGQRIKGKKTDGADTGAWEPGNWSIILASASPRRNDLLRQVGIEPVVEPSHVEEVITGTEPEHVVMELSKQKAEDIAALHRGENVIVIGADTVVAVDGQILGKPKSPAEAAAMIERLQGRTHQVYTGVTLAACGRRCVSGTDGMSGMSGMPISPFIPPRSVTFAERTDVTLYPMTARQIEAYAATKDPMDKAGAYGIQGQFAAYVKGISGDYNNVVGLPVGRVCQELMRWFLGGLYEDEVE